MFDFLRDFGAHLGFWIYVIAGFLAFAEAAVMVGLVFPGETGLLLAGLAAHQGWIALGPMLVVASVAVVAEDSVGYHLGRRYGLGMRTRALGRRVGARNWQRADAFMHRHGGRAILLGRFAAVFRALTPGLAGMAGMPYLRTFRPWNVAGGIGWGAGTVLLGYGFSRSLTSVGHAMAYGPLILMLAGMIAGVAILGHQQHVRPHHSTTRRPPSGRPAPVDDRIVIFSASIGAGHDGIAAELAVRLEGLGFEVDTVDFLDLLPGALGALLRRIYAWQLHRAPRSWDVLYSALERHKLLAAAAVRLATVLAGSRTGGLIDQHTVAVVSTYPLASQVLGWMRRQGRLPIPVATFLCDMSVHPLWVAEGVDLHLAMHKIPADQARHLGAGRVTVAGPVVGSGFLSEPPVSAKALRGRFALPLEGRVALVLAGSWGVGEIAQTAIDIADSGVATPVVVCGHNAELRRRLGETGVGVALGWVEQMSDLVHAADVVVHNAGGLSCMEALAAGVPVITYRALSGHGRTNVAALTQAGLVAHARGSDELHRLLAQALDAEGSAVPSGVTHSLWRGADAAKVIADLAVSRTRQDGRMDVSHPGPVPPQ